MDLDNCSAVITGASAGIGREFARELASRAKLLVLVARRRDRLEQLRTELVARNPALLVNIHQTDLSNLEQTTQLAALLTNEPIDFLINNAGVGDHGSFATADPIHDADQWNELRAVVFHKQDVAITDLEFRRVGYLHRLRANRAAQHLQRHTRSRITLNGFFYFNSDVAHAASR